MRELAAQGRQTGQVGQPVVEEELRHHPPVIRVIPDHLDRQDLRVAEQGVLVLVQAEGVFVQRVVDLVERSRLGPQSTALSVDGDQFGDVGVADGDEVAAWGVERVDEQTGFSRQRPAVFGEHLFAAVGKALEKGEILQGVAPVVQGIEEQGLVALKPLHGFVERVHLLQRVQGRVGHDAHGVGSGGQRDEPDPVARAHQMVGGQPARLGVAALLPSGAVAPAVDGDVAFDTKPDGVAGVVVGFGQLLFAFDLSGAAAGVDHPAGLGGSVLRPLAVGDAVRRLFASGVLGEFDLANRGALFKTDAARGGFGGEEVLENAPVDLVAGHSQVAACTDLSDLLQVAPVLRKEEAETEFAQLSRLQVFFQAQDFAEVMRTDLHRGLTDLVGGLGQGEGLALQHQDVDPGLALPELQSKGQAREAAAQDHDIVCAV